MLAGLTVRECHLILIVYAGDSPLISRSLQLRKNLSLSYQLELRSFNGVRQVLAVYALDVFLVDIIGRWRIFLTV